MSTIVYHGNYQQDLPEEHTMHAHTEAQVIAAMEATPEQLAAPVPTSAELAEMDSWMLEDMAWVLQEGTPAHSAYIDELARREDAQNGIMYGQDTIED